MIDSRNATQVCTGNEDRHLSGLAVGAIRPYHVLVENLNADYNYRTEQPSCTADYLWTAVSGILASEARLPGPIFELGCGNGAFSRHLSSRGYDVTAVDSSESGIAIARQSSSGARFEVGSAYENLASRFGRFPVVVSLEVIEHCFWPRRFAATIFDLLEPGGVALISTPYHGYLKNVALALFNRMDSHWSPLWDGGHIKFFSVRTLRMLLEETGFTNVRFERVGRIPPLAKSMIAVARRRE